MKVAGSIALVTGANRGLGLAFAKALVEMGAAKVYAAARNPEAVTLKGVVPLKLEVTSDEDVVAAARAAGNVNLPYEVICTRFTRSSISSLRPIARHSADPRTPDAPVTGQTGPLFLPFDVRIGRKLNENTVLSLEVGPLIKEYPVYNFKTEVKLNALF